jgi:hypothetical protein
VNVVSNDKSNRAVRFFILIIVLIWTFEKTGSCTFIALIWLRLAKKLDENMILKDGTMLLFVEKNRIN